MKLEINHLGKKIKKKIILEDINCTLDNHIYGLLGPNGSGKTTFIRCIIQLMNSDGEILYYDDNHKKISIDDIAIGYLPQTFNAFKELTIKEQLEYFATLKNIPRNQQSDEIDRVLRLVNLYRHKDIRCGSLSGGMVRRLGIAQALMGHPQMIIFDEPTAGLDPDERNRFKRILQKLDLKIPVILSTHIIPDIDSLCTHVIFMNEGHIVKTGKIEYLLNDDIDNLEKLYQTVIHGDDIDEII